MKKFILIFTFLFCSRVFGWQISFICTQYGKKGADIQDLVINNNEGKSIDSLETMPVTATLSKLTIGKKNYKNLVFKGERAHSLRGNYFSLNTDSSEKTIKSILIAAASNGQDAGTDTVTTQDDQIYTMNCSETSKLDCQPPEKMKTVHKDAIWAGGCDGGVWIHIVKMKKDRAQVTIYYSDTGEVRTEGWFKSVDGCPIKSKEDLAREISSYDGDDLILKRLNPKVEPAQNCSLKPVK